MYGGADIECPDSKGIKTRPCIAPSGVMADIECPDSKEIKTNAGLRSFDFRTDIECPDSKGIEDALGKKKGGLKLPLSRLCASASKDESKQNDQRHPRMAQKQRGDHCQEQKGHSRFFSALRTAVSRRTGVRFLWAKCPFTGGDDHSNPRAQTGRPDFSQRFS